MKNVLLEPTGVQRGTPGREPARPASDDEIDLLDYARSCWRYRYVLLATGAIAAAVTYGINRQMTPTYEVTFRLMASDPRVEEDAGPRVNVVAFREFVQSWSLADELLKEFKLSDPPYALTPQRFLANHVSVDVIPDTTIIRVAVRLNNREVLLNVANRYAEKVVELAQRLNIDGIDYTARRIKQERDAARERLNAAELAMQAYQRTTQVEVLRRDVTTMLERRPEALQLAVEIEGERARIRQAETELSRQDRVRDVRRSIDSVPPSRSGNVPPAGSGDVPPGRVSREEPVRPGFQIRSELLDPYVNPVYEALERDAAEARSRLAGLEQQLKELVTRLQLNAPTAARLTRLYEAESGLAKLTREHEVARVAYVNAANKYEDAHLQSTVRSPRLQVLDAAMPPDRPIGPRALRNALAGALVAITLAAIVVLVFDRSRRRTVAD